MPTDAPPKPEPRTGSDLIGAAAEGLPMTGSEAGDLLDYYLTNKGLPGKGKAKDLNVELGYGDDVRTFRCSIHTVEWSEWQDSLIRATNEKTGDFDRFVAASWCLARALVTPKLGPAVVRMQQEAKDSPDGKIDGADGGRVGPPKDAAHLLRRMFADQSGALLELNGKVLEISRLANDSQSVREVEAAKT